MFDSSSLNEAQLSAVTAGEGPVLVIAGAGSGKTRTLVHRLAWLADQGVPAESMLLLTFTRKASREMLQRAQDLLGYSLGGVQGGTFHGFAYNILRRRPPQWAKGPVTVTDASDCAGIIHECRTALHIGKGDRSFPKSQNILAFLSKARNKEQDVCDILQHDAPHLLPYADDLSSLGKAYTAYKQDHSLLDYDDLLFELEALLHGEEGDLLRERFQTILVDEYQDTNKVQARLVRLLAGERRNVMAVGDDAQSIYAFRGADVRNILDFPSQFPGAAIIRLEENYRSTRPVLEVANAVLAGASEGYVKNLYTRREGGDPVRLLRPLSDLSQAKIVAQRISQLLESYNASEIAVLFRAGFHSYHLEVELSRQNIPFRKYGGLKYTEAAHIKDVLSYARLLINPLDLPSFLRVAALCPGIGPKTAQRIYLAASTGNTEQTDKLCGKYPELKKAFSLLAALRSASGSPQSVMETIIEHYQPTLEETYPDDWPRRRQGLDELAHIASSYKELDAFVADLSLENPEEDEHEEEDSITLSTIHSAKGLEWDAVILLDLVEDRFPSRHAAAHPEEFEEERRLMYVACTRARRQLDLCAPRTLYSRQDRSTINAEQSPFLRELNPSQYEEWLEGYDGRLSLRETDARLAAWRAEPAPSSVMPALRRARQDRQPAPQEKSAANAPGYCGYCRHKIFGRGKIIEQLPPDKCRVHFPGLGLKVILTRFLTMEDPKA